MVGRGPWLNAVSRDKEIDYVQQADGPTKNLQVYDKKSASVLQP